MARLPVGVGGGNGADHARDRCLAAQSGTRQVSEGEGRGFFALLETPAILLLAPLTLVHYAPVAGIRGLWVGPYLADAFGLDAVGIGNVTLAMGIAMIVGSFAYGPLDRILGTRKGVLLGGNLALAAALFGICAWRSAGLDLAVVLLCAVGFFGSSYPLMIAYGRSFFPHHLAGRGVTFLNFAAMGGAGPRADRERLAVQDSSRTSGRGQPVRHGVSVPWRPGSRWLRNMRLHARSVRLKGSQR